ncbi:TRAP transporter substrate-binding protein DctP [Flavobacterium sp. GT2N3]|uniref:TRAP transporter substrate-binding protein DctP n=1 Tax=unclassified Flavobacterium TaxID=196869 RepID=UPI003AAA4E9D
MSKQIRRYALNILFVSFNILSCANTVPAQKILKYTDHESADEMRTTFLRDVFFPAIEKESNGRLKIEAHWNGELSTSYEALNTVSGGKIADIATVVPEYSAKELPLHQIFKSFLVGPTGKKQVSFFRKVYDDVPQFSTELQKNNVVDIFLSTGYGVGFFSRDPFKTLTDLKGTKWRTASFWHRDFLNNYGASPVTIPWGTEVYKALQEKTLDGIMVNIDGGYNLKVYEQAPYLLASKKLWLGHLYLVVMNKETWNNLAKEDQFAIQRAAEISYKSLGKVMDKSFKIQMKKLKKEGVK